MPHTLQALCTQCGLTSPGGCLDCGPLHDHGVAPSPCFEAVEAALTGQVGDPSDFDCRTCAMRFQARPRLDSDFPMSRPPDAAPDPEDGSEEDSDDDADEADGEEGQRVA